MTNDLTKGSPAKLIFFFAVPYLLGTLFQQFYNMADTVIVGRILGMNSLAAVGATGSFVWFAMGAIQGLTMGFSAVMAQYFGRGDERLVKKSFAVSLVLTAVFTALLTFVSIRYAYPILELLNTPEEIIDEAHGYIMWIFIGLFATSLFNITSNMIRGLGDSKTPLFFLIIACIINIILDYVFIAYGKMGADGAGLATFIAQLIAGILCVIYIAVRLPILHFPIKDLKPEMKVSMHLINTGIPMAFLNMVLSIGGIIIQFVNNGLGTLYVATYAAANKIEQFITQPVLAFSSAISVYAAQNYGAGEYKRIQKGSNQCILMTQAWTAASTVLILLFGKLLMYAVAGGENQELIDNGYLYLVVNSVLCVILVPLCIYKGILQSVGRSAVPMISGFIEIGCRAGASIFLSALWGFAGVCFANPAAWLGALIPIAIDYWVWMHGLKKRTDRKSKSTE